MSNAFLYRMGKVCIVDVSGADAITIVNNVTTNEIKSMQVGDGRETFITNVRGKTIGHGFLYRETDRLRLIGPAGQSQRLVEHLDRYTIREEATPAIRDDDFVAVVLVGDAIKVFAQTPSDSGDVGSFSGRLADMELNLYLTRWLGPGTVVALLPTDQLDSVWQQLAARSIEVLDEAAFHLARTLAGFPWYGIDLDESNLPQEANRDSLAISFTKGCYLGQETVARLDALGQVQRKLVRWSIRGDLPEAGATLVAGEKKVGRLTSIAATEDGAIAIGFARRSHFDPGSTARGEKFNGTVVG